MSRRCERRAVVLSVVTALLAAGCSRLAEQPILDQFFSASRLRDITALRNLATVSFEPREQGTIASFRVTNVTPERRTQAKDGELVSKEVTIAAPVRLPSGRTVDKTLVVTMQRLAGRWMITAIK